MTSRLFLIPGFILALTACGASPIAAGPDSLEEPVRLTTRDGTAIDTDVGHAAPLAHDWDGDGDLDLLVGQFGEGKLKIYLNEGGGKTPRLSAASLFKQGSEDGRVPTG